MASVVAFDSKEFKIPGRERDFFSIIGIGLEIKDRQAFQKAYRSVISKEASKWKIPLKRSVFDSYTLIKLLGGEDAFLEFYREVFRNLKTHLKYVHLFFTIISPSKVQNIFVYKTHAKKTNPVDFLKEHKTSFVVLCAWKYSETVAENDRADLMHLDFFEAKHMKAWDALKSLKPSLFIRGDTCNCCIACADGLLGVIDRQLKRNFYIDGERLGDQSIKHALKDLGISGEPKLSLIHI